jgi:hypothetical protein
MSNPYNKINPLSFLIRKFATLQGSSVYYIRPEDHSAFDMCVFRDHLARFLFDELEGEWNLRNVDNSYELRIREPFDNQRLRDNFRVV